MGFKSLLGRIKKKITGVFRRRGKGSSKKKRISAAKKPAELVQIEPAPEAELIFHANAPESPPPGLPVVKVFQAIDEFSGVQLSAHTQKAYKKDLEDFFAYLKTQGIWEEWAYRVTPIVVAQYRMHLVRVRGLAKGSVTRKLAVLKSFYKWARARGWVRDNPAELVRSFPQTQESKTGFLNDQEVGLLLDHFEPVKETGLSDALSKVVVETLLMLAVRRSEASRIRVGDLEFNDGRWNVKIQGKGDRDRLLPLPPLLIECWSSWFRRLSEEAPIYSDLDADPAAWMDWCRRNASQPILVSSRAKSFDVPLSTSEIARIVRKSARRAGIVNRVSPHMLRATAITHALDQGASHRGVQQMAGWTSPLMITRYDKRRKDPRYSAVFSLKYAQKTGEDRVGPPSEVIHSDAPDS